MLFHVRQDGRRVCTIDLPATPRQGDVIANADPKLPRYLVLRVEFFRGFEEITLHVKEFPNQISAEIEVDGLNNIRPLD